MSSAEPTVGVAVFAHNEAANILRALKSLEASTQHRLRVSVLANGCRDETVAVARSFSSPRVSLQVCETALGDKSNAWNWYVHEVADAASPLHVFMDGDCYCSPGAIDSMRRQFDQSPGAVCVAGTPHSGRNRARYRQYQADWGFVFGNLYAVSRERFCAIRELGLRLPVGLIGDDHFVTKLMHAPLPETTSRKREQVAAADNAGYLFDKMAPYRPSDLQRYWSRLVTYNLRQRQIPLLNDLPLEELPTTIDGVNKRILEELQAANRALHPTSAAVRRRLVRMYPDNRSNHYADRLDRSTFEFSAPAAVPVGSR